MILEERISLFSDMVLCYHDLYIWEYDENLMLLRSNCPHAILISRLIDDEHRNLLREYVSTDDKPIIMSDAMGIYWVAVPCTLESQELRIFIMGPFSVTDLSERLTEPALKGLNIPRDMREQLAAFVSTIPVISLNRVFEYAIMLYYCITEERIMVSDLHYQESEPEPQKKGISSPKSSDAHGTYALEQEMVRMVREGNLDLQKHLSRMAISGNLGKLSDDSERQMKNAGLVCLVLFSRAAIEGGVSPEIALTLTDYYFQSVETCKNLQELQVIARTMQDDFVMRVHKMRSSKLSRPVQECCDYIDLHAEEELTLKQMASHLGYSEYYLSHKFRQETGNSFKQYVTKRRLAKALDLLRNNAMSVKDISEHLHFCSQSYFAEQFRAVYGVSPSEWRSQQ